MNQKPEAMSRLVAAATFTLKATASAAAHEPGSTSVQLGPRPFYLV